jgi:hypothetical protein
MSSIDHLSKQSTTGWRTYRYGTTCPICMHRDGWCGYTADGMFINCMHEEGEEGAIKETANGGWLHSTGAQPGRPRIRQTIKVGTVTGPRSYDAQPWLAEVHDEARRTIDPPMRAWLAEQLGVSEESLERCQMGFLPPGWVHPLGPRKWQTHRFPCGNFTWPMLAPDFRVLGIRTRAPETGEKRSITGGHDGVVMPTDLDITSQVVFCEGPTDCAALLDLGFMAVGRSSNVGTVDHCVDLIKAHKPEQVVIMSDGDEPGIKGSRLLARHIWRFCDDLRVVRPPEGIKDIRSWKNLGAQRDDVLDLITRTQPVRPRVRD